MKHVQSANDENFFLLKTEVRATQEIVKSFRDAVKDRLQTIHKTFTLNQGELTLYKECAEKQAKPSLCLQGIRYVIFHLGTLYSHIKFYQATFYAYKITLLPTISSPASAKITPQFLLPQDIADIVRILSEEKNYLGTKLTPGLEADYYEIQLVLEVTLIPCGISVVLGVPINFKSSTFSVYLATPRYQPNGDNTTASLFQLAKSSLTVANDYLRYAEKDSSTLQQQQCSGRNRIRLCRKGFATSTDDNLLSLSSLLFDHAIPALQNYLATSVPLPHGPHAFYLAEGLYHVISREPLLHMKNASDIYGVGFSMILCQTCILRLT